MQKMKIKQPYIKICGLRTKEDAVALNENQVDFAGFVLFYPKSKRFVTIEQAVLIRKALNPEIKTVAVTVSPTLSQLKEIEAAGFDYIQIHGILEDAVLKEASIPILRAFNVSDGTEYTKQDRHPNIVGYVLDGKIPGGGETFDWTLLKQFDRQGKMLMLAGGLDADNVEKAILEVQPDIVDVSSGVESAAIVGKDPAKIKDFVEKVKKVCAAKAEYL